MIARPICVVAVPVGWRIRIPVDDVRSRVAVGVILIRVVRPGIAVRRIISSPIIRLGIRVVSIAVSRAPLVNHVGPGLINYDGVSMRSCDYPTSLGESRDRQNHQREKRHYRGSP